jgi:hypothetical protein
MRTIISVIGPFFFNLLFIILKVILDREFESSCFG